MELEEENEVEKKKRQGGKEQKEKMWVERMEEGREGRGLVLILILLQFNKEVYRY